MTLVPRWFPLTITQTHLSGGFQIVLTTDIPCHLWLYWTDKIPWVHRTSTIERGLAVPWDAYWCFVVWHLIDQEEPGDTLTHTYNWTGWQVCQTKYFRFHGTIAGNTSPSDSPIFHKHYSYLPGITLYERFLNTISDEWTCGKLNMTGIIFTPAVNHTIERGDFRLRALFPRVTPIDFYLSETDGSHFPTGPVLSQGQIPDGSILDAGWRLYEVAMSSYTLQQGVEYALWIDQHDTDNFGSCYIAYFKDLAGVANPTIITSDLGLWTLYLPWSACHFRIWGYPA